MLIGISGDSGTGKTTLAHNLFDETLVIECDCFHKWDRYSDNWKIFTHLNPDANNLNEQYEAVNDIKNEKPITITNYDHYTGQFKSPEAIHPKKHNIFCGLLTFPDLNHAKLYDIKIFIDVDEDLKISRKMERDVNHRGYKYQDVVKNIHRRRADYDKHVLPQKKLADIVVKYTADESYFIIDDRMYDMIYIQAAIEYIYLCRKLGKSIDLFQASGGNISVKINRDLLIKKSGTKVLESKFLIKNLDSLDDTGASIEVWFHIFMKKYTVHFHTYNFTAPEDYKILRVEYKKPGKDIADEILKMYDNHDIIILEKHGVICTSNSIDDIFNMVSYYSKLGFRSILPVPDNWTGIRAFTPDVAVLLKDKVVVKDGNFYILCDSKESCRDIEEVLWLHNKMIGSSELSSAEVDSLVTWDKEILRKNLLP
jgi:uridine kinase